MENDSTSSGYLGIDPGLTGGVASIGDGGVSLFDPPTILVSRSSGSHVPSRRAAKRLFMEYDMAKLLRELVDRSGRLVATIEWAQAMPEQGIVGAFNYGCGFGIWLGILAALGVPTTKVRAREWKAAMLKGQEPKNDKGVSVIVARSLYPTADLGAKKDAGRAEALLIAEYGRRLDRGDPA